MLRSIYLKTLYNLRGQIFGWSLGVGFIAFITMVLYDSFDQAGIESIISSVPESLKPLVGSVEDFKTIPGFIGQQIFGPNGYILAVAAAILMALSVSANEEDDKRLQTLLTLPVTRSTVFFQKLLAVMTAVAIVALTLVACTYLGLLIVHHSVDFTRIMEATFAFFLMNAAFATIAFSAALFTGKKGTSVVIGGGYAALSFLITSLAPSVKELHDIDRLSILHYYNTPLVMQHGLKFDHIAVLVGIIIILATISWLRFRQRNVGI
ncbi:ABC transporter permease subunit [Streptomyces caniscabiei]|uniref:ABC transporter permease subunit n=1 Tax=Streptomyces caniscabiei TaxID=2746961 RepID=UPI0029A1555C|nr:ABC transporter permease subunit [Streptomyces caniscabiei]MDX2776135.1 ABC transporter permease subunit [Streptomyces caniscabiei]